MNLHVTFSNSILLRRWHLVDSRLCSSKTRLISLLHQPLISITRQLNNHLSQYRILSKEKKNIRNDFRAKMNHLNRINLSSKSQILQNSARFGETDTLSYVGCVCYAGSTQSWFPTNKHRSTAIMPGQTDCSGQIKKRCVQAEQNIKCSNIDKSRLLIPAAHSFQHIVLL